MKLVCLLIWNLRRLLIFPELGLDRREIEKKNVRSGSNEEDGVPVIFSSYYFLQTVFVRTLTLSFLSRLNYSSFVLSPSYWHALSFLSRLSYLPLVFKSAPWVFLSSRWVSLNNYFSVFPSPVNILNLLFSRNYNTELLSILCLKICHGQ